MAGKIKVAAKNHYKYRLGRSPKEPAQMNSVGEKRTLTTHEIDAVTAALTGYLYLQGKTELIGNENEGYIAVPIKRNWRKLQL